MRKLFKIAISLSLCIACVISVLSFSACKENNLVDYTITLNINGSEEQLNITFDKEVAPKTFEKITNLINDGYYNDMFLYKRMDSYTNQIMFGDLKFEGGVLKQVGAVKGDVIGEFENGALQGSTYKNVEGSIGLWRTWTKGNGYTSSNANNTGSSTLYMPTSTITDYDKYFCVFGSFDLADENVKSVWDKVKSALNTTEEDNYIEYTIYYVKNGNDFEFNYTTEKIASVSNYFKPENNDYYCYNNYSIKVPVVNKDNDKTIDAGVKIVSIKLA